MFVAALAGTAAAALTYTITQSPDYSDSMLPAFSSADELQDFVYATRSGADDYYRLIEQTPNTDGDALDDSASEEYSTTNVQVLGVDEADIVKTNGEQIFLAGEDCVTIVEAGEDGILTVRSVIGEEQLSPHLPADTYCWISGLYVFEDRLLILMQTLYSHWYLDVLADVVSMVPSTGPTSFIVSVDISDPSDPEVLTVVGVSGYVHASRMVNGIAYVVSVHSIWSYDETVPLPDLWKDGVSAEIDPSVVRYDPEACYVDSYVNVLSFDATNGEFEVFSLMSAWASTIYMTVDNLYVTYQKWVGDTVLVDDGPVPESTDTARTTIYKLAVDGLTLEPVARGEVRGWLLNQFSMDEQSGYLRLATTTGWSDPENAVYVLDEDLVKVGEVTGLAPTERIFSARFVGDTLYMVTFLRVDPLFVIDLSDPSAPQVLGELKVPGFSSYLHPIGGGLLLGVGSENSSAKVSVFDVSDPAAPVEVDTMFLHEGIVPDGYDGYSWSSAEYDHKAFTFDPARRMLVLPVYVSAWGIYADYYFSWEGFCVLTVSVDGHLEMLGTVEHPDWPTRSLYIGDTLYTVSESTMISSSIPDLVLLDSLVYRDVDAYYEERSEELPD